MVQAARARRAPADRPGRTEQARAVLRDAPARAEVQIDADGGEFVVLVARRTAAGQLAIVASLSDEALVDKAIRKAAS
jgi:hypothetical protein